MKFNADRKFICLLNVNLDLLWPNMSSSWSRIFTKRAPTEKTRLVKISSHSGTRFYLYQHIYNQCVFCLCAFHTNSYFLNRSSLPLVRLCLLSCRTMHWISLYVEFVFFFHYQFISYTLWMILFLFLQTWF